MTAGFVPDGKQRMPSLRRRVRVALGKEPADLLLVDCRVVNVFSEEIHAADIAVAAGRIVGVRQGIPDLGGRVVDCHGQLALPGLIHPFLATPVGRGRGSSWWRRQVSGGTTTAFVVAAEGGVKDGEPWGRPVRQPASSEPGQRYELRRISSSVSQPVVPSAVHYRISGGAHQAVRASPIVRLTGKHTGVQIDNYASQGIEGAVGAVTSDELLVRLRAGMTVFLDHVTDDGLETTLRHIVDAGIDIRHIGFAPLQSTGDGSVNTGNASLLTMIRIALRAGVAPPRAVQMASITAARFYQVEQELGSLAPGRRADILLLDSLDAAAPNTVIANGRLVETNAQDA